MGMIMKTIRMNWKLINANDRKYRRRRRIQMIGLKTREQGNSFSKRDVTIDGITKSDNRLQTTSLSSTASSKE